MAPATPQSTDAPASSSPMTSTTARITKSRSESTTSRSTRQRSRMLASTSSSGVLQDMVNEVQEVMAGASGSGSSSSKGKARSIATDVPGSSADHYDADVKMAEALQAEEDAMEVCPITDKDEKPFPIMELPTEIRLEIYRACLTRPYNILLSKKEQPPQIEKEPETNKDVIALDSHSDTEDMEEDVSRRSNLRTRHQRNNSSGDASSAATRRPGVTSGVARGVASRGARPIRLLTSRSAPGTAAGNNNASGSTSTSASQTAGTGMVFRSATTRPTNSRRHVNTARGSMATSTEPARNQNADPLLVNVLRASREIYKEARGVLYSENIFNLDLNTAMATLACLHQRSRRQIKHIELEIPTYNEILERFQETVRLSLRYCTGLKKIDIHMPFTLPGADGSGTTGNTTVYANGFDILRWLPQECNVILQGNICSEITTVVNKHLQLAKTLDKLAYARRQLISNDTGGSSSNTTS